ncbi:MAG: hypothetical protein R3F48_00425 [Candidatus Zixiibacteriota bacterium]
MRSSEILRVVSIALLFTIAGVHAEVVTETTIGSGYQGNLFGDSSALGAAYGFGGLALNYYPSGSVRITADGMYTYYNTYEDLSNLIGNLSVTVIPTAETSPFSLTLSGGATTRKFGTVYSLYDQSGASAAADIGYRLSSRIRLLSSAAYAYTDYTESEYGTHSGPEFSAGVNLTIGAANSFAITGVYANRSYEQPALSTQGQGASANTNSENTETFDMSGYTFRFSRPLGSRTGLSLSFGQRMLHINNDFAAYGYTIDYLSPWSDLWEGTIAFGNIKHFFPKQVIAELGFSYVDKSFVDVIETDGEATETYWQNSRDDKQTAVSLAISRAISLDKNKMIKPTVSVSYRRNESTAEYYDYDDIQASLTLNITL